MKKFHLLLCISLLVLISSQFLDLPVVRAQTDETPTETIQATPTETPTPQPTTPAFGRPLITIKTYNLDTAAVGFGQDVNLSIQLRNDGQHYAHNIVVTFVPGDLVPRGTGGVLAISEIAPGNHSTLEQPLTAGSDLWGKTLANLSVTITYSAGDGTSFSEQFILSFPIKQPVIYLTTPTPTPTATPSATPTAIVRPQLVITRYETSITPLEPGTQFNLELEIQNLGNGSARRVTMVVGGGSASAGIGGTPDPGGISGSGGEFTNFAPLGASNIQSLGDLALGDTISASQPLIVNVSTNPGAYPIKISFVYLDEQGTTVVDDQVITLLVYSLPRVEIGFYMDSGPLFAGQPGMLPLQIVNLGRKSAILGNMRVSANGAQLMNNVILIGTLEMGGYFTLDATIIPDLPGPLELVVNVDYTDDFNQAQTISQTINLEVLEMPAYEPLPGEELPGENGYDPYPPVEPETFWQKLLRFLLGMLGLDSAVQTQSGMPGGPDIFEYPTEGEMQIVPVPLKGP